MKEKKPTSIAEAKALIDRTFRSNKWNETEQKEYLAGLGIKENVKNLSPEQTRAIIEDLTKSRMILFE